MGMGFILRYAFILGIVVAFSPQLSHAQDPLPPLPKVALPEIPPPPPPPPLPPSKLPQLKTISEIPPAKQVGASGTTEKGWLDKLKDVVARWRGDEPAQPILRTAQVALPVAPAPTNNAKALAPTPPSTVTLPPPPKMEPPTMDALGIDSETPTVNPDIFAFDANEKKEIEDAQKKLPEIAKIPEPPSPPPPLPLPPKAKVNSSEKVNVPVLPNPKLVLDAPKPTLKPTENAEVKTFEKVELPPIPEFPPAPPPTTKVPLPEIASPSPAPAIPPITPPAIPEPKVAAIPALPTPALPDKPVEATPPGPEKSWIDTLTDKALNNEKMPLLPKPTIALKTDKTPLPPITPTTLPKIAEAEKGWVDTLLGKARDTKDAIAQKTDEVLASKPADSAEKGWVDSLKDMALNRDTKQPIIATKPAAPKIEVAKPILPQIPELKSEAKTEVAAAPKVIPSIPEIPEAQPLPKTEVVSKLPAPIVPEMKPLPEPKLAEKGPPPIPDLQPKPEAAVATPAIPAPPVAASITPPAVTAPVVAAAPTPPPLPTLSLQDLKLPTDNVAPKPVEKAEAAPAVISPLMEPKIEMPKKPGEGKKETIKPPARGSLIAAEEEPKTDQKTSDEISDEAEAEEKAVAEKDKKEKAEEADIADIDHDDPAFKFWKNHDFRTQVLPAVINSKDYASRNDHLPKAVFREDLERLLFIAIGRGDLNAMRALMNQGVDVEAKNAIGDTPLVHAAINGQAGAVRVLLARGANPNNPNVHGNTAMNIAAERGREDIIDALFEMGAKATADYRNPMTPLKSGVTRGYASVYNAMLDGENPNKKQLDARNRALQALADAGPQPRLVISQGMPGLSKQIIDDESRKVPGEPLTFEEIERKLAYQEYVRKTSDDPVANRLDTNPVPKLISPAGSKSTPVPIPYPGPQVTKSQNPPPPPGYIPPEKQEPIVGLPQGPALPR